RRSGVACHPGQATQSSQGDCWITQIIPGRRCRRRVRKRPISVVEGENFAGVFRQACPERAWERVRRGFVRRRGRMATTAKQRVALSVSRNDRKEIGVSLLSVLLPVG